MHKIIYRIGYLLLLLYAASLHTFAEMLPLDSSIRRTEGTADCAWFYSRDAVSIGGKQYSGHGYVADNRGNRAEGAIVFDISGWERFTAVAGLKDEWRGQDGKITITVDGIEQITKQLRAGEAGVALDVTLTGKKSMTIYMEPSMLLAQPLLLKQNPQATLNVKSTPTGASIVIDGIYSRQVTPCTLRLPLGYETQKDITLKLTHSGYDTIKQTLTIRPGTNNDCVLTLTRPQQLPATLLITTKPEGVTVMVNGLPSDQVTPCTLTLPMNEETKKQITLQLTLQEYEAVTHTLTIYPGENPALNQVMLKKHVIVEKLNPIDGATMVWVPGGTFTMGSPDGVIVIFRPERERPAHRVTLTGYWIYKYEVTVAQYRAFCADTDRKLPDFPTGFSWQGKRGWDDPALQQHPIVNVSWHDAQAYAAWARATLPTEAQWEYAARGVHGRNYPWGGTATAHNGWDKTKCANRENSSDVGKSTWPVGSFPAGASWCGAHDMAGNVWEWCADWYGEYSATAVSNPTGLATGEVRVLRGGSWYDNFGDFLRSAFRADNDPGNWYYVMGFRCVSLSPVP